MNNEAPETPAASSVGHQAGTSVGSKFWPDGSTRPFPGNTIISPVAIDSPEAEVLREIMSMIRTTIAVDFVVLPEPSWHMTVFELLCDQIRGPGRWSTQLPQDAPLVETDAFFAERVPTVEPPTDIRMVVRSLAASDGGLTVMLDAVDESIEQNLRDYRNALSEVTGVRSPDHDEYQFHISLAYTLTRPTGAEKERLERTLDAATARSAGTPLAIASPVLTYFEDMTLFSPERRQL